jgi:hypothetical protein
MVVNYGVYYGGYAALLGLLLWWQPAGRVVRQQAGAPPVWWRRTLMELWPCTVMVLDSFLPFFFKHTGTTKRSNMGRFSHGPANVLQVHVGGDSDGAGRTGRCLAQANGATTTRYREAFLGASRTGATGTVQPWLPHG